MDNQLANIDNSTLLSMKCQYEKQKDYPYNVYVDVVKELRDRNLALMNKGKYVKHRYRFPNHIEVSSDKILRRVLDGMNNYMVEFRPKTLEVSMVYNKGALIRVITKGDGLEGKDITSLVYSLLKGKGRKVPILEPCIIHGFLITTNHTSIDSVEDIIYNQHDLEFYGYDIFFKDIPDDLYVRTTLLVYMVRYVNEILDIKYLSTIRGNDISTVMNVAIHNSRDLYIVFDTYVRNTDTIVGHGMYTSIGYDKVTFQVLN